MSAVQLPGWAHRKFGNLDARRAGPRGRGRILWHRGRRTHARLHRCDLPRLCNDGFSAQGFEGELVGASMPQRATITDFAHRERVRSRSSSTVHTGLPMPGENIVVVTAELLVKEVSW
ncbi:hypothetical protein [Amycolatopsis benzoatilytica]|uniref:hypothetical protein n=1 Tax=Amycolatopsis benzoatilytica TaxID=346045 RepID=UPI0012B69900|nr:hypothetical protein [Amycolatopsis benzoatilytica]